MSQGSRGCSRGHFNPFTQTIAAVEAEHPEFFDIEAGGQCIQVRRYQIGAIENQRFGGREADRTPRHFHGSHELEGLYPADSLDTPEIRLVPGQ